MELSFLSKDGEGNKTFFRAEYEYKDSTYVFPDKSTKGTTIYLTVLPDKIILLRKGSIRMHLELSPSMGLPGTYESSNGLSFSFVSKASVVEMNGKRLHFEYSLYLGEDMVSTQKIWIAF